MNRTVRTENFQFASPTLDGNMASCENNDGGYTCTCDAGYDGNVGISFINVCLDIDECAGDTDPCAITRESNPATCNNIAGSYECICLDGFSMDSVRFTIDIDNLKYLKYGVFPSIMDIIFSILLHLYFIGPIVCVGAILKCISV